MYIELLSALIVDPDAQSRSTLYSLLKNDQEYKNIVYKGVVATQSLEEAEELDFEEKHFDVVFISSKFPMPQIANFIATNKVRDPYGGICHIIVNNQMVGQDNLVIAQGIAVGANSFMVFPCSVDKLRELTTIAQKMKFEATEKMIVASLTILIDNLIKEIQSKVEMLYDRALFTRYNEHIKAAVAFMLKDNKRVWHHYIDILTVRTLQSAPKYLLPKERLPKSKFMQKKVKERQAQKNQKTST